MHKSYEISPYDKKGLIIAIIDIFPIGVNKFSIEGRSLDVSFCDHILIDYLSQFIDFTMSNLFKDININISKTKNGFNFKSIFEIDDFKIAEDICVIVSCCIRKCYNKKSNLEYYGGGFNPNYNEKRLNVFLNKEI